MHISPPAGRLCMWPPPLPTPPHQPSGTLTTRCCTETPHHPPGGMVVYVEAGFSGAGCGNTTIISGCCVTKCMRKCMMPCKTTIINPPNNCTLHVPPPVTSLHPHPHTRPPIQPLSLTPIPATPQEPHPLKRPEQPPECHLLVDVLLFVGPLPQPVKHTTLVLRPLLAQDNQLFLEVGGKTDALGVGHMGEGM